MIYAVAKINGKQYKVTEASELTVDRLDAKVGQVIDIKDVLLVSQDDNKLLGKEAEKAVIKAKVTEEFLGTKVLVLKYKKRKRHRKLVGHRQHLTKLVIESIDFPGKKAEKKPVTEKKEAPAKTEEKTSAKKVESKEKPAIKKEAKTAAPKPKPTKPAAKPAKTSKKEEK